MEIEQVLAAAIQQGASDVILKDGRPPMFRLRGELAPMVGSEILAPEDLQSAAHTFMYDDSHRVRFATEHHADLAYDHPGIGRFRINVYRQRGRIGIVLRIIPGVIRDFAELNLPPVVERLANERRGLLVVTGPTGSGKTTTLAAIIDHVNRNAARHIITIEDPIEYVHVDKRSVISQREIGSDTESFPAALRIAMRQNPDIIMVGEMRDKETIETAIQGAETGHLVLSTLHTLDAPETITRIISSFPQEQRDQVRIVLGNVIRGVVSQRLLPSVDGVGMVPAVEVMVGSARVRDYINRDRGAELREVIVQGHSAYDMQTFDQSLLELLRAGRISYEEAFAHCTNPSDFELQSRGVAAVDWGDFETRTKAEEKL